MIAPQSQAYDSNSEEIDYDIYGNDDFNNSYNANIILEQPFEPLISTIPSMANQSGQAGHKMAKLLELFNGGFINDAEFQERQQEMMQQELTGSLETLPASVQVSFLLEIY